jgi:hypothetical protein
MFDHRIHALRAEDLRREAAAERLARRAIAGRRAQRREELSRRRALALQARWSRAA